MLDASPEVDHVRRLVSRRLMDSRKVELGQEAMERMLLTLWRAGYVELEPEPPKDDPEQGDAGAKDKKPNGPTEERTAPTATGPGHPGCRQAVDRQAAVRAAGHAAGDGRRG